jgi:hypothetical protein
MPRQPEDPKEEQSDVVMTNAELAEAIKYAFDCAQSGCTIGKNSTASTETMLAHLKELTALQARRAALFVVPSGMVVPPNGQGNGPHDKRD